MKTVDAQRLRRSLTLPGLILYGLGTTVGAGIYALLGEIARTSGDLAPWAFLGAGLLAALTAISFAVLSSRYPRAAGIALYIEEGFHSRRAALIAGILAACAGAVSSAALLNGFVGYAQEFIEAERITIVATMLAIIVAVAIIGIKQSVAVAATITLIEIGGLVWITILAFGAASSAPIEPSRFVPAPSFDHASLILAGAVLSFYAYIGFEDMIEVAEEVIDVRRTLPRAIILTLIITTLLYLSLITAALLATSPEFLAASNAPLTDLMRSVSSHNPDIMSAIGMLAIINGALVQIIMSSRVLYGLAHRGQLPRRLANINPTTQTPVYATVFVGLVVCCLALTGSVAGLAELTSVVILSLFAGVNFALFRLERARASASTPPQRLGVLGYVSCLGGFACALMVVRTVAAWFI